MYPVTHSTIPTSILLPQGAPGRGGSILEVISLGLDLRQGYSGGAWAPFFGGWEGALGEGILGSLM